MTSEEERREKAVRLAMESIERHSSVANQAAISDPNNIEEIIRRAVIIDDFIKD